jgi:hypothetical protein
MGKISLRTDDDAVKRRVGETLEKTVIHRRQTELTVGRWDFLVFGPKSDGSGAVARLCVAEQALIERAAVYLATVGDPDRVGRRGRLSIEELTGDDCPDEMRGLMIYHVSPLRPMTVVERREATDVDRLRDLVFAEFGERNVAIIEAPDEAAWGIAALRYLDECDEVFPDPVLSAIRGTMRDTSLTFERSPRRYN